MSATIRMARPEDHAGWLTLWKGDQAFYKVDIADAVSDQTWQRQHVRGAPG